ncbi:MAG: hypothetical protein EOO45_18710 [Flavobacterium sp.]|nr:MAG: hypothetical protein EOO45_18710 [Flavobacterium sp.]
MKKLILSAVLLAGLSFVACSKDDDKGSGSNCVSCDVEGTTQDVRICENSDGNATVGGMDTGFDYDEYVDGLGCN